MGSTFQIKGLSELGAALADMAESTNPRTAKAVQQRALIQAAQPMVDMAKELVPVRTGALRDSITASAKLANPVGKAEYRAALQAGLGQAAAVNALRGARRAASVDGVVQVFVGPVGYAHAYFTEFGTRKESPRPYLRPAYDQTKEQVLDGIAGALDDQITKAAERAARKALKHG